MKKILMIHTTYRLTGGEDVAFKNEIEILKNNFKVEVLYFSNNDVSSILKQFIYFLSNNNSESREKLKKKLKHFKPDLVYVHNTWFKASLGIFKELKHANVDYVIKLHNYRFNCGRSFFSSNHLNDMQKCNGCGYSAKNNLFFNKYFKDSYIKSLFLIIYSKKYYKILKTSKIITLTKFQKKFLIDLGFNSKFIYTLHNPISLGKISENFIIYNLKPKSYIIYAGLISEEKGLRKLIKTYNKLENFEKKLVLVGEGPLFSELKNQFENKNIIFFGKLDNEEVKSLIQNSYSVVSNTTLYEGQPNLLFEASIMKTNSVFPNNGGIGEFFPTNNPFCFNPDSEEDLYRKLILLKNSKLVKNQSIKNFEFLIKNYSTESYLSKFENFTNL